MKADEQSFPIAELVFSDPPSRNSLSVEAAKELKAHLTKIEKNFAVLVIRGEGRVFCSGGNLRDHVKQGAAKGKAANRVIAAALRSLDELAIPTIACVDGDVFGGGLELLSAFDVVLAAPHVLFGFWQRRIGLSFGWGGGERLMRRLSQKRLALEALAARALTAEEAVAAGLIDRTIASWRLREEAMALAARLGSLPKPSTAALKSLSRVHGAEVSSSERKYFEKLWFGPQHKAALARFGAKAKR